jgi:DNA replication protein DnaC
LLYGSLPGTGKTTTAAAIARMAKGLKNSFNPQTVFRQRCIEAGGEYKPLEDEEKTLYEMCEAAVIVPAFYTAGDLANLVESNKGAFEAAKQSKFLIIDDMGTEPVSVKLYGNEFFPIIEIILHRYAAMLPTIITSNLGLNRIADIYGERIADRLREMCETLYFAQGESYRR